MTAWIPGLADLLELSPDIRLSGLALPTGRTSMNLLGHASASWPGLPMVSGMSHKRRTEFLAGRLCALHSLWEMGVDAEFPLPAQDRIPIWPLESWAASVIARQWPSPWRRRPPDFMAWASTLRR